MKDLETIFRECRIACDGVINCPVDDWNAIASQVTDLAAINAEMYAMLERVITCQKIADHEIEHSDLLHQLSDGIRDLLDKARGETK